MALYLDGWTKNWQLLSMFFTDHEISEIRARLEAMQTRHVVFCSFENRFAKSGGLAAVTTRILPHLSRLKGVENVFLLTPFYPLLCKHPEQMHATGKSFVMRFGGKTIPVEILKYTPPTKNNADTTQVEEYYLKAEGFFNSMNPLDDPYIYHPDNLDLNNETIKESSLFFCHAAPLAVNALGVREDIVFHLQEWQTAAISLTAKTAMVKGVLSSAGTIQTLHNPFDCFLSLDDLKKIMETKQFKRYNKHHSSGLTAYQLGLQLVDAPITTVSKSIALEFVSDIFQTHHFASHLQEIFKHNGVYGINNGLFLDILPEYVAAESSPDYMATIKKIKGEKRRALLEFLVGDKAQHHIGELTYKDKPLDMDFPEEIPILIMSGRLDPVQKGFDVLLRAIEKFGKDEIKVILTPMPVKDSDLNFFKKVANRSHGCVTVFPNRIENVNYQKLQTGSTFGVMPSIFEPFGAAIEYMASGTLTIARSTGGLKDQIDNDDCGFLFREDTFNYCWENIHTYIHTSQYVEARDENTWVINMVDRLFHAITKAAEIYRLQPDIYYNMIAAGFKKARSFDWDTSAAEYLQVYQKING